ncbi:class I SAM-dependent methyltransferase [Endozoicomonas gorgoniicola]|uniref:Class I SAM-dependent methyltransferase n=2 Tax=Endozoicomonas gorgoniicola TaxID=1234144 RepID=A0ABT3MWN3_9GAMM|nr:class I SAM-dependent methyltransferase [Endozoicomonas gorgoniicola]
MKPVEIGKAYDQITHLWESEKFNRSNGIEQHKKAISFAPNTGKALDIACGCTGRFIDLLIDSGFTPEGVDISSKKVLLAKKTHPDIQFYNKDICSWSIPKKYSFITAWDSIWHIPLEEQKNVLTKIVNSLNKGGIFIFSFGGTDEPGDHTDSFMGPEVYYSSLGTNGFLSLLIELGCICKHLEFDQHPEFHTYMIVQKA